MSRDTIRQNPTKVEWLTVHDASETDGELLLQLHLQPNEASPMGYTFGLNRDMAELLLYTLARDLRAHLIRTRLQSDISSDMPSTVESPANLTPSGNGNG